MPDVVRAYAFVTDIHGNQCALDAVLEDLEQLSRERSPHQIDCVCLGDSFDGGPDPLAVYETLRSKDWPHLIGNHEEYLFDFLKCPEDERFSRPLWKFIPWTVSRLGDRLEDVRRRGCARWSAAEDPFIALHASVNSNARMPEFFIQQSSFSNSFVTHYSGSLQPQNRIFFNGHSHYMGRHCALNGQDVWFNCGSVGYPFVEKSSSLEDAPLATWVWVEVDAQSNYTVFNRRVAYSSDELLSRYSASGALEECAPFSFAILAQSLFNEDVVYPFFQAVRKSQLTPSEMALSLLAELERQNIFERVNRLMRKAGLREIRVPR